MGILCSYVSSGLEIALYICWNKIVITRSKMIWDMRTYMISTGCLQALTLYLVLIKSVKWTSNYNDQSIKLVSQTRRSNVRMSGLSMVDNSSKLPHTQKTAIIKLNMNWKCNFLLPSCHCWELNTAKDTDSPQPLLHQQLYFLPALHNLGENCQARVQAMSRSTNQISNSDSGGLDMELTL